MVFKVPESEGKIDRFEFSLPGSTKEFSMPRMPYLPGRMFDRLADIESDDVTELAKVRHIFALIGDLSGAPVDKLDGKQIGELFTAWRDASGLEPGEAGGSEN